MRAGDKFASVVFWLVVGGFGLLGGGWIIYLTLDAVVRGAIRGRALYPDSPTEWPLFWGCVVIFTLSVLGIRDCWKRMSTKSATEDAD